MRLADRIRPVAAALLLAGCAGTGAQDLPRTSTLPPGFEPIADGGNARPGRLYFSGEGRRPAFSLADGTRFNELCYADYERDATLRNIDDFLGPPTLLFDRRVVETQAGAALDLAPGVALAGLQLPQGSASSGATGGQAAAGSGALGVGGAVSAGSTSSETRSNVVLAVHKVVFDPAVPAQ